MAHVRTQIRGLVRDLIAAAMPGSTVISGRVHVINLGPGDSVIDIFAADEPAEEEVMGGISTRRPQFVIRVQRPAVDGVDDVFDQDEVLITEAIFSADWSEVADDRPMISRVQWAHGANESAGVSGLAITVNFDYRVSNTDLETLI